MVYARNNNGWPQGSTQLPQQPHPPFQHRVSHTPRILQPTQLHQRAQQNFQHAITPYEWLPEKRRRIETYGAVPAQEPRPDGYFNTSSDAQGPTDAQVNLLTCCSQTRAGADTNRTTLFAHFRERCTSLPNRLNICSHIKRTRSTTETRLGQTTSGSSLRGGMTYWARRPPHH
jgi:hypothetical protein